MLDGGHQDRSGPGNATGNGNSGTREGQPREPVQAVNFLRYRPVLHHGPINATDDGLTVFHGDILHPAPMWGATTVATSGTALRTDRLKLATAGRYRWWGCAVLRRGHAALFDICHICGRGSMAGCDPLAGALYDRRTGALKRPGAPVCRSESAIALHDGCNGVWKPLFDVLTVDGRCPIRGCWTSTWWTADVLIVVARCPVGGRWAGAEWTF
jgi:hypothetical protein